MKLPSPSLLVAHEWYKNQPATDEVLDSTEPAEQDPRRDDLIVNTVKEGTREHSKSSRLSLSEALGRMSLDQSYSQTSQCSKTSSLWETKRARGTLIGPLNTPVVFKIPSFTINQQSEGPKENFDSVESSPLSPKTPMKPGYLFSETLPAIDTASKLRRHSEDPMLKKLIREVPLAYTHQKLGQWGSVYFMNLATADVYVKAVTLRRPSLILHRHGILPDQNDTNEPGLVTIRARVLPKDQSRKGFVIQRQFNREELKVTRPMTATRLAADMGTEHDDADHESEEQARLELMPERIASQGRYRLRSRRASTQSMETAASIGRRTRPRRQSLIKNHRHDLNVPSDNTGMPIRT